MLGLGNILTKGGALLGFPNKYSFSFDGSNDYLDIENNSALSFGTNAHTISAWAKIDALANYKTIISKRQAGGTATDYNLSVGANGVVYTYNGSATAQTATGVISAGSWYHYALVYSGSAYQLYINGSAVAWASGTTTSGASNSHDIGIGWDRSGNYWDGLIDEVAIWDTALDATAIAKIGSKVVDLTKHSASNLKLWIRSGDKVLPEEDTSIARSDFYTAFDGGSEVVSISNNVAPTEAITVSAWVNFTSLEDYDLVVGNTDTGSNGWRLAMDNANNIMFAINSWGDNKAVTPMSSTGVWHHLVGTYDKSNIKIYLNGELKGTDAYTDSITYSSNVFQIGGASGWSNLTGSISSVGVYKTALDAQTIKQLSKSRFLPQRQAMFSVVDFDGTDDHIVVSDNDALDVSGTSDYTLMGWVKADVDIASDTFNVANKYTSNAGWMLSVTTTNNLRWETGDGSAIDTTKSANNSYPETVGLWQHIGVTGGGGGKAKLYLNGNELGSLVTDDNHDTIATNTADMLIGTAPGAGSGFWNGAISSISIYNVAKSADEVYAQYQKGITHNPSADTGLVGLWLMGSGTGDAYPTIKDQSTNSNDGTITTGASDDIQQQAVAMYDMGSFEGTDVSDTFPALIDVTNPTLGSEVNTTANATSPTNETNATTGWSDLNGSPTETSDSSVKDTGSYSLKIVTNANGDKIGANWSVSTTLYKTTIRWKTTETTSNAFKIGWGASSGGAQYVNETLDGSTDWVTTTHYFTTAGFTLHLFFEEVSATSDALTLYIDSVSIKALSGNVGTMTSMATDNLTYSSVLPDQSYLATGNSSPYNFLDLDGSNEYISVSDADSLSFGNGSTDSAFSVCGWVNMDDASNFTLVSKGIWNTSAEYILVSNSNDGLSFELYDEDVSSTYRLRKMSGTLTSYQGSWVFLVGTYDGRGGSTPEQGITLYVNGAEETSVTDAFGGGTYVSMVNGSASLFIGRDINTSPAYANGKMGQIAIFNKELSGTEVSAIYTLGRHGNLLDSYSDNLVGYWAMSALDASTGLSDVGNGTIYDRSGQSNHGTATNTEASDLASPPNAEPNGYEKGDTNRSTTIP